MRCKTAATCNCGGGPKDVYGTYLACKGEYGATPSGFVGRMRVSLLSAINSIGANVPSECLSAWLLCQRGMPEYCVTTMVLWGCAMHSRGLHVVACAMLRVPGAAWLDNQIEECETIARRGTCCLGGKPGSHTMVGRVKCLLGRDMRPTDSAIEVAGRTTPRAMYQASGPQGRSRWWDVFKKTCRNALWELDHEQLGGAQEPTTWWQTRAVWLPGGAASTKEPVGSALSKQTGGRVSVPKSVAIGNLSLEWFMRVWNGTPAMESRLSTKNEPGLKRRALWAADDASYLMGAHASSQLEKYQIERSVIMRQTPYDIVETMKAMSACSHTDLVLCIDYSDFNKQHHVRTQALLNHMLGLIWHNQHADHRAHSAHWMALAHFNHSLRVGEHHAGVVRQGLSSGERDTARDNTLLHLMYMRTTYELLRQDGNGITAPILERICGDDEAIIGISWGNALLYAEELRLCGFDWQPRKQLVSSEYAELLQYNFSTHGGLGRIPTQPLPPAVVNMVSGSWYKRSYYAPWRIPEECAGSCSGLVRRGLPAAVAQRLAIGCCNWLCQTTEWRQRLNATPLFGGSGIEKEWKPGTVIDEMVAQVPPIESTEDYMAMLRRKWRGQLPPGIVVDLRRDTFARFFDREIRDAFTEHLSPALRVREGPVPEPPSWLIELGLRGCGRRRDTERAVMAAQLGMPVPMISRLGEATVCEG